LDKLRIALHNARNKRPLNLPHLNLNTNLLKIIGNLRTSNLKLANQHPNQLQRHNPINRQPTIKITPFPHISQRKQTNIHNKIKGRIMTHYGQRFEEVGWKGLEGFWALDLALQQG
jgi:hypothetical protein